MQIDCTATRKANRLSYFAVFAFALLCTLLRNNFIYALTVFVIIVLVVRWRSKQEEGKQRLRLMMAAVLPAICASLLLNGFAYGAFGVTKGSVREAESVMIQQIAKVVKDHAEQLSSQDLSRVEDFVSVGTVLQGFNPRFADPIKNHFDSTGKTRQLFSLWLDFGRRYPKDYLVEFLDLNIPYWYPGASSYDPYSQVPFIETGIYDSDYYSFERESKLSDLLSFYEGIVHPYPLEGKPILSTFTSLSMPFWVLCLCLCFTLYRRNYRAAPVLALPLLFWTTYLFGPVSNFRYIFPLVLLLLVVAACSFSRSYVPGGSSVTSEL